MDNKSIIENLAAALELSPDNLPLRIQLADLLKGDGNFDKAIFHYKYVLERDKANNKLKYELALLYYKTGQISVAAIVADELVRVVPDNSDYLLLLARIYLKERNMEEGAEAYRKLLQLQPGFRDDELDRMFRVAGNAVAAEEEDDDAYDGDFEDELMIQKPDMNFSDVGGLEQVKREISLKIIAPFKNPELFKAYGKKAGGGILLYGPPGCGKTFLAKATAGEMDAKFINVGISDVLDMWLGNSEKNLHRYFEVARSKTPCVLFFDEVDALGANRNDMKNSAGRQIINQFLSELDGVETNNEGLLVLAATNAPWHLDPAFRRPGRFDRIIFVAPPDKEARISILKSILRDKPVENIDFEQLAKSMEHFSGADIKAVVDVAIESILEEALMAGKTIPLTTALLAKAVKKVNPSTREWFNSARNYAIYANEAGQYDDILKYLNLKK